MLPSESVMLEVCMLRAITLLKLVDDAAMDNVAVQLHDLKAHVLELTMVAGEYLI